MNELDAIFAAEQPAVDKLAQAFEWITAQHVAYSQREIELRRAEQDQTGLVQEQIKMETIRYTRRIFNDCYRRVTGRQAWHE
jgi:hypothetical protein